MGKCNYSYRAFDYEIIFNGASSIFGRNYNGPAYWFISLELSNFNVIQAVLVLLDSGKIMNDEDMPPLP